MYKCINCAYEGDKKTESGYCPVCGDNLKSLNGVSEVKVKSNILDINNDGKVDMKDVKLAGKVLKSVGAKLKRGKRK